MTKPSQPTPKVDSNATVQGIEILRVGKFADTQGREVEFTAADLADIAASYDPKKGEAPLVIGHPETNGPAHGWVTGLRVEGDTLVADAAQVPANFAEAVNAGRYKKRSASIYPKGYKNSPAPGKFYLRHVGFLGAAVPAVTGLRDFNFAADDDCIELAAFDSVSSNRPWWALGYIADLFRGMRDRLIETEGLEKADRVIPNYQIESIREAQRQAQTPPMHSYADTHAPVTVTSPPAAGVPAAGTGDGVSNEDEDVNQKATELADREKTLDEREQRIQEQERANTERIVKQARSDASDFADGLVKDGKLLPKDKTTVVELMLALPTEKPLSFADGETKIEKPAAELFRGLLSALPKQIDFREKSGDAAGDAASLNFAAPPDAQVDANQLDLHARAKAYQAQNPNASWLDAVKAVGRH